MSDLAPTSVMVEISLKVFPVSGCMVGFIDTLWQTHADNKCAAGLKFHCNVASDGMFYSKQMQCEEYLS